MEIFMKHLRSLRAQFDALSSDEHECALAAVAEAVCAMRDASVRRRFEKEVELTLAWEAEKMIVERFACNWPSTSIYEPYPSSSFDLESTSDFIECTRENKEPSFAWSEFPRTEISESGQLHSSSLEPGQEYVPQAPEPLQNDSPGEDDCELVSGGFHGNTRTTTPSNANNEDNRLLCATCGFLANNRKALYRHGVRTQHLIRERRCNTTGSFACNLYQKMCMCFIYVSDDQNSKYKLIILNNRDECVDRPTLELDWRNGVLSGTDELDPAKGTWFGTNKAGRVGVLLSVIGPTFMKRHHANRSRGAVAKEYLESTRTRDEFFAELAEQSSSYNGFQFLGLERNDSNLYQMTSLTNKLVETVGPREWPAGTTVWGNSPPEKPFRKVVEGKKLFEKFISSLTEETEVEEIIEKLMEIATNEEKFIPDPQLALQTQRPLEWYQYIGSIMVKFPLDILRYGTRSHSILIVDRDDNAVFYENRMAKPPQNDEPTEWIDKTVTFKLGPLNVS
ncbi:hypothetical protein Q1695_001922 [Nippostrongylus brasiliensis]|nr:hypothetical protein Q1695_001922 [Nippostrongylus brasiliensis]